jgi:hypothetical protein
MDLGNWAWLCRLHDVSFSESAQWLPDVLKYSCGFLLVQRLMRSSRERDSGKRISSALKAVPGLSCFRVQFPLITLSIVISNLLMRRIYLIVRILNTV